MTTASKRRWFNFSLRTMFVVVTVFGCWMGYELNWIRQRREFIQSDECSSNVVDAEDYGGWPSAPWMLRLFGETGYAMIQVNFFPDETFEEHAIANWRLTEKQQQLIKRARRLFPEAEFIEGAVYQTHKPYLHVLVTDIGDLSQTPGFSE